MLVAFLTFQWLDVPLLLIISRLVAESQLLLIKLYQTHFRSLDHSSLSLLKYDAQIPDFHPPPEFEHHGLPIFNNFNKHLTLTLIFKSCDALSIPDELIHQTQVAAG